MGPKGDTGRGIEDVHHSHDGSLTLHFTDGTSTNLGSIRGRDGLNGKDGKPGADGARGPRGERGPSGRDGRDAVSVLLSAPAETGLTASAGQGGSSASLYIRELTIDGETVRVLTLE
jgi:hypothetical protein